MTGNSRLILVSKGTEELSLKLLIVLLMVTSISPVAAFQIYDEYDYSIEERLFFSARVRSSFHPLGNSFSSNSAMKMQRTLAILVEFTDVKHSYSESEINQLIFVDMSNYWEEVSYGKISITGKTVGWYTLKNKMAYYGADSDRAIDDRDGDGLTERIQLIRDTVNLVDDALDFKNYNHIIIVHAGVGQESNSTVSDNIWSAFIDDLAIPTNDGVNVTAGIIVPEGESPGGIKSALGIFAHEFGHSLGLPDMYSARHRNVETLGDWSLMDHGEWLGSPPGSHPPHLESWSKILLGWLTPLVVQPKGQIVSIYRLESKIDSPKAIIIPITDETYYLIEARQKIGFDSSLSMEGVLIMRVNEARKSGEGIIKVLDNNPSTIELHDAAFQVGDKFEDYVNHIYIKILSRNGSSYQIIISQKPILITKLYAPDKIFASYYDEIEFSVFLANSEGAPLPNMIILFEYGKGEEWTRLGKSLTDGSGYASLKINLDLRSGSYMVRYVFTGGELGKHYYLSNSTSSVLTVTKKKVTLHYDVPTEATVFDQISLKIYTMKENKPIPNVPIQFYLDEEIYETGDSNEDGLITVTLNFDVWDSGMHKIRIEVPENEFYDESTSHSVITIHIPIWVWILTFIGPIILALIVLAHTLLRKRLG